MHEPCKSGDAKHADHIADQQDDLQDRHCCNYGYVRSLMKALMAASAWKPDATFMDLNSNMLSTNHEIKTSQGCVWSIC